MNIIPVREFNYICQQIISLTTDISLITFIPELEKIFFLPGQYVEAILPSGTLLPLSIANIPQADGSLEFHVRHNNHHNLAQEFINSIQPGHPIRLQGPLGHCTLSSIPTTKLLFLAGGTGFAPIKALLESALTRNLGNTCALQLYWGIRRPEDAYQLKLLEDWKAQYISFHYTLILSDPEDYPNWSGAIGMVHQFAVHHHPCLDDDYTVFASGPYAMIKATHQLFLQQGLPSSHFFTDMTIR